MGSATIVVTRMHPYYGTHANYDTETVTCMLGLNDGEIRFTSINVDLNDHGKLKGQFTAVKSGSSISVGPSLNPHSLS